ncbi:hypothetical protein CR513_10381, partial [Mucuna pruriens]
MIPLKPLEPPYPRSYDPNARCNNHGEAIRNATKRCCLGLKTKGPMYIVTLAYRAATVNTISHMDERVASPNRKKNEESGQAVDSANRVEEGSHPNQLDDTTTVAYIEGDRNPHPKPLIIQYNSASKPRVLAKLAYNNNTVLWKYLTEEPQAPQIIKETATPKITNIAVVGGMTWSGRIFTPEALRSKDLAPTKKERIVESPKRMVIEEEAHKFLKIILHNEYEMLDQLHKTPARISLLSLLINSESHRELLLKILNEAHVPQDITPTKFGGIINNITTSCHLSFSEEKVLVEGKSHNQPLHIAVKCRNYMIARVLIDNGSSLNVMPKTTLDKLYCPSTILRNSPIVVKAFDGSKREVMGKIHSQYA